MSRTIVPVSPERHGAARWRRPTTFAFAAQRGLAVVGAPEVADVARDFPLAFVREGDAYTLHAVLGVQPDRNAFVAPDGRWLGRYVPAAFRCHPFHVLPSDLGQYVLCIEEDALVAPDAPGAEPILGADGKPTPAVSEIMEVLLKVQHGRPALAEASAALTQAGVIEPWPIVLKRGQGETKIEGLFRVSEPGLGKLADDAFLALRKRGALPVAYAQLLSVRNFQTVANLAQAGAARAAQQDVANGPDLDLSWMKS